MKIVVLAGGLSPERDVSLSSGSLIANALMENGHHVMLLDLYLGSGNPDFPPAFRDRSGGSAYSYRIPETEPDLEALKEVSGNGGQLIGRGVLEECLAADKVFLALHGSIGENGQLQALFDTYGIPYTGTAYVGSLLAMDKDLSKKLLRLSGIPTADWRILDLKKELSGQLAGLAYPCVVKPCSCGSSVGVTMVESEAELASALHYAGKYEDAVLAEDKIIGREFSVGILGGEALPPIEIKPRCGFYDYKNKYQSGLTEEVCPADITAAEDTLLRSQALEVHNTLRLGYYSRIDFILDAADVAWCLEANTLPGMTPVSLLPQEARAAGISYSELCEKISRGE